MSSSNQIRLAYLAEATAGTTPATGAWTPIRYTSEGLDASVSYTQSNEVRSDRQPSGNVLVGVDPGGNISGELAQTSWVADMVEAAMNDTWNAKSDTGAKTLTLTATGGNFKVTASTSFAAYAFAVGDMVEVQGFATGSNGMAYVTSVATGAIGIVAPSTWSSQAGGGNEHLVRHGYVEIGSDETTFTICKSFLDLSSKGITYRGMRPDSMSVDVPARGTATIQFGMVAEGSTAYDPSEDVCTATAYSISSAGTEDSLAGAGNVGLVVVNGARVGYCVAGFSLNVANNNQAEQCVNETFPFAQNPGEASAQVTLNAYLTDANFTLHSSKLAGTAISTFFPVVTASGEGWAFGIPAFKPNFPDAASGGKNQQTMMALTGIAEPTSTQNAVRVYKVTQS